MNWLILALSVAAVTIVGYIAIGITIDTRKRKRRRRWATKPRTRKIVPSYGPGYDFLEWREEWDAEKTKAAK
jgi:hypothetical protein